MKRIQKNLNLSVSPDFKKLVYKYRHKHEFDTLSAAVLSILRPVIEKDLADD